MCLVCFSRLLYIFLWLFKNAILKEFMRQFVWNQLGRKWKFLFWKKGEKATDYHIILLFVAKLCILKISPYFTHSPVWWSFLSSPMVNNNSMKLPTLMLWAIRGGIEIVRGKKRKKFVSMSISPLKNMFQDLTHVVSIKKEE